MDAEGTFKIKIPWPVYAGLFTCVVLCIALLSLLYKEGERPNAKISKDGVEIQFPKKDTLPDVAVTPTPPAITQPEQPQSAPPAPQNPITTQAHANTRKKTKLTQGGVRYYRELVIPQGDVEDDEVQGKLITKPCIPFKDWPYACDFALEADRMHAIVMPWDRHTR
jgi:hypothetical protein